MPRHYDSECKRQIMTARIYKPAKTAMQSGTGDMRQQVHLRFDTLDEATAYCERHGIAYQIFHSTPPARRVMSYADNFAFNRRDPWTH
jgi:hypothetical protein